MIIGSFGMGGSSWMAEQFRDKLTAMGHKLMSMHEYLNADVKYSKENVKQFIDSCDIIILPARLVQPAKSVNRLVLAWSRNKPCIVSPLDAYLRAGVDGKDFLVADTFEEFCPCIDKLSKDPELMQKLARNGLKKALLDENSYGAMNYAKKYLLEIRKNFIPKIHVAIPHYLSRVDYLVLAVESVLKSEGVDIIVSIASSSPTNLSNFSALRDPRVKIYQQKENMSFSKATNKALENRDSDTNYVLLLNDDTIVSKHSLKRMVEASKNNDNAIVNPLSNCDKGWLHNHNLDINGKQLIPNMKIEDFSKEDITILQNTQFTDIPQFAESSFAAFYSTLIPVEILNKVGKLNESFNSGGEDLDWCNRAKKFDVKVGWVVNSFVMHFGGKSRKASHDIRGVDHELEDQQNNALVQKMWGKDGKKKRIAIYTGAAWERWSIMSPYTTGIGGSEYVEGQLAKIYAEHGHHVTMFGDHEEREEFGVTMKHWANFHPEEEYWDLFIASRSLASIKNVRAKTILAHVHDIFLLDGKHLNQQLVDKVTKFICLSPWHVDFFSDYHNIDKSKIIIIPNGMDTSMLKFDLDQKVFGKLHYSSSPDRGLDNLLLVLPYIKDQVPEIHLDVYYGFLNWSSAVKSRNDPHQMKQLESLQEQIDKCKDFVHFKDRVNLPQLHEAWNKAYTWGYLTQFTETNCLTAKEAQYSGTPIVCSDIAALKTTVGNYGMQIPFPYSLEARKTFIAEVVKLHKDKDYWIERSKQSLSGAVGCDWKTVYNKYWKGFIE